MLTLRMGSALYGYFSHKGCAGELRLIDPGVAYRQLLAGTTFRTSAELEGQFLKADPPSVRPESIELVSIGAVQIGGLVDSVAVDFIGQDCASRPGMVKSGWGSSSVECRTYGARD
jgi:hypothetical protein